MSEIWAVTCGEYSDYRVRCICPDEATAKAVAERLHVLTGSSYDDYEVESFQMITSPDEVRRQLWHFFEITYRNGVASSRQWSHADILIGNDSTMFAPLTERDALDGAHVIVGRDPDPERAIKRASDAMAKWRAERELEAQP